MSRKLWFGLAVVVVAAAAYFGVHRRIEQQTSHGAKGMAAAPVLTMVDLNGNRIDTSSYAGHLVLVNFWAAWCAPCAGEIPQLVALQDKYRARGLRVVGISMDDKDSVLRAFYREHQMNYPVVAGDLKIAESYGGILGLPTTLLITPDGRIHTKYSGALNFPQLEQEMQGLLPEER